MTDFLQVVDVPDQVVEVVEEQIGVVEVLVPGQPGKDAVLTTLIFEQSTPSSEWVIHHNLNRYPTVAVVDSAGDLVLGNVTYVDSNTIFLSFSAPFGGKAYLN
jgi:hypothetical protein